MKKIFLILVLTVLSFFIINVNAYEINKNDKIYVSGQTIGIKLETGVVVMGTYGVNSNKKIYTPWSTSNVKEGDVIVSFNNQTITTIKSLLRALSESQGNESTITINRKGSIIDSKITPVIKDDKSYSLGLYIKDYIMGVGTLTYIIPGVNLYGSLGHSITDANGYGGQIYEAEVNEIIKPTKNAAGEKRAKIINDDIGNIVKNSLTGVHGYVDKSYNYNGLPLMNIGLRGEVKTGKAEILTCISKTEVKKYEIEITEVKKQDSKDIKGIKFKVLDKELLNKTSGIVQGMSGSPIIQDNKIIGAVTHVSLSDSKIGYGIYIEFMLEEMDVYIVE